ncbi:MAG TPA: ribose 5-phosphate isomerase B [Candidatus Limnocylindria bacterium]|nr:ribose 5-phosphate isomerase B [Candidatus Limnocylindria bacterium]
MAMIALGADHAGYELKQILGRWLSERGHLVSDFGTHSTDAVDYPDIAAAVARAVRVGAAERGLLVCGSGVGMAIAANKVAGIRAAVAGDVVTARLCREHNDTNVLALGARAVGREAAVAIVHAWLETAFAGGRHARRVEKLDVLDGTRKENVVDVTAG